MAHRSIIRATFLLVGLTVSAAASADLLTATLQGKVTGNYTSAANYWGYAVGETYTYKFTIDTSLAPRFTQSQSGGAVIVSSYDMVGSSFTSNRLSSNFTGGSFYVYDATTSSYSDNFLLNSGKNNTASGAPYVTLTARPNSSSIYSGTASSNVTYGPDMLGAGTYLALVASDGSGMKASITSFTVAPAVVPEPTTLVALGTMAAGLFVRRRRR